MTIFAHWGNGAYCDCDYPKDFAELVNQYGPPDFAKPADWLSTCAIVVPLSGETDPRLIRERVVQVVEAAGTPTICQYCGDEGHQC